MDCVKTLIVFCALWACSANEVHAQNLVTLFNLCGNPGCVHDLSSFAQGTNGTLYATAQSGGDYGRGAIVKITPSGKLVRVYNFCELAGCPDGSYPSTGLVQAADGNLYGMTVSGGSSSVLNIGAGTIFKMTPAGLLTTLYSFCAQYPCIDGAAPGTSLFQSSDGNLYGTTSGVVIEEGYTTGAMVFKVTLAGELTTLYYFCNYSYECEGLAGGPTSLAQAADGYLYGTTGGGGSSGFGTVFGLTTSGAMTTLHNFCSTKPGKCSDGQSPATALVQVANGDLFGTTPYGGHVVDGSLGSGTVYKIMAPDVFKTVYDFEGSVSGGPGPGEPQGVTMGSDGNLYGVAAMGGAYGHGAVFQITPAGKLSTIYSFCQSLGCPDGSEPLASLFQATDGNLYGSTLAGGVHGLGTVFRLNVGLGPFVQLVPATGTAGTVVQILGSDLAQTTHVTFAGTEASFTQVSRTQITATVPDNANSGTVRVVMPSGTLVGNVKFQVQ